MVTIFKRAPSQLSERRIDPWHYQPNFEEQINKIEENVGSLSLEGVIELKRGVAGGATPLGANYLENGRVKFYRTSEVEEMFLRTEDAVFISDEDDEKLKRSRLADGDVLLTITGAKFGKSAVVSSKHLPGNISQHSVRFKPDPKKIDAYFLVAFLNGKTGQITIWREAYGATRPAIDFPSVRSLAVPKVTPLAQKYIGDKVRQAEQLRAWSKQAVLNLQKEFQRLYRPIIQYDCFKRMSYPIRPDQLFEVLTPASYPPHIEKYFEDNTYVTLGDICDKIYIGKTLEGTEASHGVLQATSRSCSGLFLKQPMNLVERKDTVDPIVKKDILLTNAAHDKNYIGKDVSFNHSDELILPSAKVLVIRLKECGIPASYVHAYLMTEAGYTQWQAVVRGISAGIHPSDVARIRIPVPEKRELLSNIEVQADNLYIQAGLAQEVSRLLTIAAKSLVESLIEGQLTEQQLTQAQQALEDGDNSLDHAILSKLSHEGYAVDGATPLFSDVDELYQLLESAQQQENEE